MASLENMPIPHSVQLPTIPDDLVPGLQSFLQQLLDYVRTDTEHRLELIEKWNGGRYKLREFTSDPALADMAVGEIAYGVATGASSAGEIFIKKNTTTISVFTEDSNIT